MLPIEKWLKGMTVIDGDGDTWLLGERDTARVLPDGGLIGNPWTELVEEGYRPASYADEKRSPVEGEPERMVRIGAVSPLYEKLIGDIYEWRDGPAGWRAYNQAEGSFSPTPEHFAPLSPLAPAEEEQTWTEPSDEWKAMRAAWRREHPKDAPSAPSPCGVCGLPSAPGEEVCGECRAEPDGEKTGTWRDAIGCVEPHTDEPPEVTIRRMRGDIEQPDEGASGNDRESRGENKATSVARGQESGCLRVAVVRRELRREARDLPAYEEDDPGNLIDCLDLFVDRWRPRLPEFEPCGDCPECLEQASDDEFVEECLDFTRGRCGHMWPIGTAYPDCPGGRAR